jgi:hypothetical protein
MPVVSPQFDMLQTLLKMVEQMLRREADMEWNLVCASPNASLTLISRQLSSCAAVITVSPALERAYVQLMSLTPEHIPSAEIGCWSLMGVPYYKIGAVSQHRAPDVVAYIRQQWRRQTELKMQYADAFRSAENSAP